MKKQVKSIICVMIALSLLVCGYIGIQRISIERDYKDVQISIRYSDVLSIAQQTGKGLEEVLSEFKAAGATNLFVRENTVAPSSRGEFYNYKEQGNATYHEGYLLEKFYPEATNIQREYTYIEAYDDATVEKIYHNLLAKHVPAEKVEIGGKVFIQIGSATSAVVSTGAGYNYEDLQIAADLGYTISPQVKSWDNETDESIRYVVDQIKSIPNLDTIYFADQEIVGVESELMQELVDEFGLGYVEFFSGKQKGFKSLAAANSSLGGVANISRLHTLTDGEIKKYDEVKMMDRFMLALTERNLRTFLFKMPNTVDIEADTEFIMACISTFKTKTEAQGYRVTGDIAPYNLPVSSFILALLAGVASIGIFVLLVDSIGFTQVGYILGALGLIGYAGLLKIAPNMAIKMMALFGASIFPTYGVYISLNSKPNSLKSALLSFLKMSAISFGGALTIIGTLSKTSYAMGIDIFAGVKVAHIIPIALIIVLIMFRDHGLDYNYYKKLLSNKVTYWAIAIIGVLAVVLLIYTSRTGNTGEISGFEAQFRQLLDTFLGVRPRTKEFLIGHPIMLALLYYGYKEKYIPLLVLGIIGQISLVNTYAHIHTPVLISLVRSVYGIAIGIVIGIVLIYVIKVACKVINQWIQKVQ